MVGGGEKIEAKHVGIGVGVNWRKRPRVFVCVSTLREECEENGWL